MQPNNFPSLRKPKLVVISDVHLGTFGCQSKELLAYLNSIAPEMLVLNGDIIDGWQFKRKYVKATELSIIQRLLELAIAGTRITYITGNHDEFLRHYVPMQFSHIQISNKLLLELDGKKVWIFHGDVFDRSIRCSKWLARLGGRGYDLLIWFNYKVNQLLQFFGKERMSISKRVKKHVKQAVKYISNFEQIAIDLAGEQDYDTVICGHIHTPQIRKETSAVGKTILYLNSGDWVEHCTALEYDKGKWSLYQNEDHSIPARNPETTNTPKIQDIISEVLAEPHLIHEIVDSQ